MKNSNSQFHTGEKAIIKKTRETVTIAKSQYVKHMKKYSYIVNEKPSTFFFEEELQKPE
ncbi:hypothetical protein [Metabacillus sp. 84]|uniref:hypothetical protein n=1 Tax=unclassified Metabacillus TaxID=2675274 RepID=UPI003CF74593